MPDSLAQSREDVALANRILANEGIFDAFGHVSLRHPSNPERFLISRHRAPELVQPADILELDLDASPWRRPRTGSMARSPFTLRSSRRGPT